jgi:hypothetical protein
MRLLLLILACSTTCPLLRAADLDITAAGDDNAIATQQLARFAEEIGFEVSKSKVSEEYFFLKEDDLKLQLSVKASEAGIDRIIAHVVFQGKPAYVDSPEMQKLMAKINAKYNTCSIYINSRGGIEFQFGLPFDNRISPKLFRLWCSHCIKSVTLILKEEKELR